MGEPGRLFIMLGATFLLGLAADAVGRRAGLPRVTLLIILGFLVGPGALDLLPEGRDLVFNLAANVALTMVGFLLGERVGRLLMEGGGKELVLISVVVVLVTGTGVVLVLVAIGQPLVVALLLGGIATATAPAATTDVVRESGSADGRFSGLLLAIVAIDDAWGLLLFSLLLAGAELTSGHSGAIWDSLSGALAEIGGALGIGVLLGAIMAYLTGRISKGEPTRLEAIGFVFLISGVSLVLEVSFILAAMAMGAMVAVLARHHKRPFHEIERFEMPFLILFFVLAGATLELGSIVTIGLAGACYVAARAAGRVLGGWTGAMLAGSDRSTRKWIGVALMPQAGVAIGMALLAAERFPEYGDQLLQITIGATVFFEVVGPLLTRLALSRAN